VTESAMDKFRDLSIPLLIPATSRLRVFFCVAIEDVRRPCLGLWLPEV